MKIGLRKPSIKKMFVARTSPARFVRHSLGLKMPRGWGWLSDPWRAAYNRIYARTTFSWTDIVRWLLGRKR
jgi:hypothetical protein